MQNIIYSNIIHFYLNDNLPNCIVVRYAEDLEKIGLIRMNSNHRHRPFIDTDYGRLQVNFDWSFEELEKQILNFIDNNVSQAKWEEESEESCEQVFDMTYTNPEQLKAYSRPQRY